MRQYQIIYVSESMLSEEIELRTMEIQHILEVSRKWNSKHDVTGALMLGEGHFAQVLEGPFTTLRSTLGLSPVTNATGTSSFGAWSRVGTGIR